LATSSGTIAAMIARRRSSAVIGLAREWIVLTGGDAN
jgi:hypothetical protein